MNTILPTMEISAYAQDVHTGHKTDMKPIKGDGLRYHGLLADIKSVRHKGYIDTVAYPDDEKHV
jgi:predicted alternative tryptophan synthase beta-subunit